MYGEAVGRFGWLCTHNLRSAVSFKPHALTKAKFMMKNLGKLCLTLCLLVVGGGIVANAQIDSVPQIEANITFAFRVGDTKLPAGKYVIRTSDDNSPNVLELSSADSRTSIIFDTENAQTRGDQIASETELVFNKVGDQYFLYQVWVAGTTSGSELPKSRIEKRLADGGSQSEKHSVVAVMKRMKP